MALDRLLLTHDYGGPRVAPNAIRGRLHTVVKSGGPAVRDAESITRPDTQIVHASRVIVELAITGTYLALVLGYDKDLVPIAAPVIKLFGRYGKDERWELLRNMAEEVSAEFVPNDDDVSDGVLCYTTVHMADHVWDLGRVNEVIVGIQIPLSGSGRTDNSVIQARLWG